MPLTITKSEPRPAESDKLRALNPKTFRHRYHRSDITGAIMSAARSAIKHGQSFYVYPGNACGAFMWRVTYKRSDILCALGNSGRKAFEVTPDREIIRHELTLA